MPMPTAVESTDISALLRQAGDLRRQGRVDEAQAELVQAIALQPDCADAHHLLGNLLKSEGRFLAAAASLQEASRLAPRNGTISLNLGVAFLKLHALAEAIGCFERALQLEPGRPEAHNILGHALLAAGRCTESIAQLEAALKLRPGYSAAHDNLGRALKAQGRTAEAVRHHRLALAGKPDPKVHSNLLYSLNLLGGIAPAEVYAEHRRWAECYAGKPEAPAIIDFNPDRRLRIGFVSPDFVNHAVAYFFAPVLEHLDRDQFEIYCYSNAAVTDEVTEQFRSQAPHWRDIARLSDGETLSLIRRDQIDLLFDLTGHTADHRLLVFARRAAPLQLTWLGYPATTGLTAMDYRLTDARCDPPGQTEAWHSEELVRVPEGFSCYRPAPDAPIVSPLPAVAAGYVTFGCCNNFAKVTPEMIQLWAAVLGDHPGSRLMLKSRGLADPATARRVRDAFAAAGVGAERICLDGQDRSTREHLRLYHRIDLALDTSPYNGATTTCEALWMGVPVVTLAGETHAARVGASFLTQIGAPDWIAQSAADYRAICRRLAADLPGLAALRVGLRDRVRRSPLCDGPGFARRLASTLRALWVRRGAAPAKAKAPDSPGPC
jgi:protein O-GlcNAc transferase